jgi:FdhE protein
MTSPDAELQHLKQQRPEWQPWLVVVEEILRETGAPAWDAAVPVDLRQPQLHEQHEQHEPHRERPHEQQREQRHDERRPPLLAGATLALPMRPVQRLWQRLIQTASRSGMPKMASITPALHAADGNAARLFTAAICQDAGVMTDIAARTDADGEALQALAALLPMPFLHACNRRWASDARARSWAEGYCPICAAWPAFAEVRGIERSRYFRCGRCSAEWYARALCCPYCGTDAHDDLDTLVPEPGQNNSNAVIEACKRCHGYVKALTRLSACPPGTVMLEDLATVDLDVAALAHGFKRPAAAGFAFTLTVSDTGTGINKTRRLFAWR